MKVLAIIYVKSIRDIMPGVLDALAAQTFRDFSLMVHELAPVRLNAEAQKNKSENVTRNRNVVRKMALASDAEYFAWVDSDVVIPTNCLQDFVNASASGERKLLAGWVHKVASKDWAAGSYKDGVMQFHQKPVEGIIEADLVSIGCSFMHRSVLEKLEFRTAVDEEVKSGDGTAFYKGNCLSFCEDAAKMGVKPFLVGTVVCRHLAMFSF